MIAHGPEASIALSGNGCTAQPYGPGLRSTEIGRCGPPKGGFLLLALAQQTFQQNRREADKTNAARRGRRGRGSTTPWSRRWRGRSDGGRCWTLVCATLEEYCRAKSVAPSYIRRVLRLAAGAGHRGGDPEGRQVADLQLDDLLGVFPSGLGTASEGLSGIAAERGRDLGARSRAARLRIADMTFLRRSPYGCIVST